MYTVRFINKLCQFGSSEFDAIVEDSEGVLPTVRYRAVFRTEEPSQESFDVVASNLIAEQEQRNYSKTQEAIERLRAGIDKATGEIIDIFLSKDLDAIRASLQDPEAEIAHYVECIVQGYKNAAMQVLNQFPDLR